jgi:hypothetical protein
MPCSRLLLAHLGGGAMPRMTLCPYHSRQFVTAKKQERWLPVVTLRRDLTKEQAQLNLSTYAPSGDKYNSTKNSGPTILEAATIIHHLVHMQNLFMHMHTTKVIAAAAAPASLQEAECRVQATTLLGNLQLHIAHKHATTHSMQHTHHVHKPTKSPESQLCSAVPDAHPNPTQTLPLAMHHPAHTQCRISCTARHCNRQLAHQQAGISSAMCCSTRQLLHGVLPACLHGSRAAAAAAAAA